MSNTGLIFSSILAAFVWAVFAGALCFYGDPIAAFMAERAKRREAEFLDDMPPFLTPMRSRPAHFCPACGDKMWERRPWSQGVRLCLNTDCREFGVCVIDEKDFHHDPL